MYGQDEAFSGPIKIRRNKKSKVPTAPNRLAQTKEIYANIVVNPKKKIREMSRFKKAIPLTHPNSPRKY